MNISRVAVHRPILSLMVSLIVLTLGGVALLRLPVDLMPDITAPTLSVSTEYENADPEIVEELITRPIEEALSAVPGVLDVSSVSTEGQSSVRVSFEWGTDLDAAANDIRDRLDRVIPHLPTEANRPSLRKFDMASFPVMILGASSRLDPVQLRRLIDDQIKYRLERVPGVAAVDVRGGLEREIQVNINPEKIKALGIPLNQIVARIKAANVMLPAGSLETGTYEVTLRTSGEFTDLDQLRDTVIAVRNQANVRLKDIATIEDTWQKETRIIRMDGQPGIRIAINKQSGMNTVQVAEKVLAEIASIDQELPQIRLTPIIDTSDYINRSITNVGSSALYGGFFAVLILLLFLRNLRSTLIIAVAIPLSIIATFVLIFFGGFTLNLMTLGGLALGVGMLVDNAIVVLENIYRLRENQLPPETAAIQGATEVTAAIIASTLTTLVVFLPMIFMRGMAGIMFQQLAYVICFALFCSLIVALTLIPMLASRFLHTTTNGKPHKHRQVDAVITNLAQGFTNLENAYKRFLHKALNHRLITITTVVVLMIAMMGLLPFIGTEFMPKTDEGDVRVDVEMELGTKLSVLDETMKPLEQIVVQEVPEARSIMTNLGGSGGRSGTSNVGEIRISLKPQAERQRSSDEIAAALRKKLAGFPGLQIRIRAGQGLFFLRRFGGSSEAVELQIRGYDLDVAAELSTQIRKLVEHLPGVTDVRENRTSGAPEQLLHIDRTKAEAMNLTLLQVAEVFQTALSGALAGRYKEAGDEFNIRVKLQDAETRSIDELLDLTVLNANGVPVVLKNVVASEPRTGPVQIDRLNQERQVTIGVNIADRDMGSMIADIRERLKSLLLPQGFTINFGGDYEEQQTAFRELAIGMILALFLMYMVMASLYESLRDPLVVMFSVPLAVIGVVLILIVTHTTFNVQTFIGCIMLWGIVVNNAIILVDTTNQLRRTEGLALRAAVEEAGRRRLRPILMTSLTTIFALIPMALGLGEGGESQAPLARAVIGGLSSSTLITLVIVPVIYSLFEEGLKRHLVRFKLLKP